MTDQTPAEQLHAAAAKLRATAAAAQADAPSPWTSDPRYDDDPDSTVDLWGANQPLLQGGYGPGGRGSGPFVTGPVGRHIALMHPGVGEALAAWLDAAGVELAQLTWNDADPEGLHRALAVARQILGEVTQ